ncbi:cysteine dioxygenase [Lampropedia puyangensis]|uniref:Cysteine dioxygenase n=1 Tax=Lampropedia puyangensis TaxID=1330072 RepID=A0A4V4GSN8_9BURK|nr:cysteine dioxygenase family protein [Lampropedia puyangensis]THU05446.1 cysteine dioxygenase [Lampropedia puyangensis]
MTQHSEIATARAAGVSATMAEIQQLHAQRGIDRETLKETAAILERLAAHKEWFAPEDFPAPQNGSLSTRYALHTNPDQSYALYLNTQLPGKNSVPHDHRTWAVIVAIQGQEINRIYRRTDDGSDPQRGTLELERELIVQPGTSAAYLGDDIHSIHMRGEGRTLLFHLYGRALETLTERLAFDLESGTVTSYNKTYWRPNASTHLA